MYVYLKREWAADSKGKLPHLFTPSKTATFVPEFAVEDLALDRTATLVRAFALKDLPSCAEQSGDDDYDHYIYINSGSAYFPNDNEMRRNLLN